MGPFSCFQAGAAHLRLTPVIAASIFMAVTLGACSPLKIINWTVPGDTYTVTEDVAYGAEPAQKLDVYRPREASSAPGPRAGYPVVVFFHGGNWTTGERSSYRFVGEALAASRGRYTSSFWAGSDPYATSSVTA